MKPGQGRRRRWIVSRLAMVKRAHSSADRLRSVQVAHPSLPLALLAVLAVLSLGARAAWLGEPCRVSCHSAADHVLIFDEAYYVNAARVIAGVRPAPGQPYAGAPAGVDPNAEHPQLAKLIIAGSIELLGDGPLAWRLGSLVMGSLAILGLFALVRGAGGGRWLALGACTLMATDNLMLVHGRIGTLDVYALAAMIWGVALYLRGQPLLAGAAIGLGACAKLLAVDALFIVVLAEGLVAVSARRDHRAGRRGGGAGADGRIDSGPGARGYLVAARGVLGLGACGLSCATVFLAVLAIMDRIAAPYDPNAGARVARGPFAHLAHMLSFAANQSSLHGPQGIASSPWQWIADYKPIAYLYINPAQPASGFYHAHPAVHFLGMVSPPILLLALPALALAVRGLVRRRGSEPVGLAGHGPPPLPGRGPGAAPRPAGAPFPARGELDAIGLAWTIGTFAPFELLSLLFGRTSYLYYMLLVMPGIYVVVAQVVARARGHPRLVGLWAAAVLVAVLAMYPFMPLP